MGEVYRARDTRLQRDVALKVLPAAFASDPDRLARFTREAQLLASLNHPNSAAIYGVEEGRDTRALVLELVDGPTLADRIAQGPLPVDEAIEIARQIAAALAAAHDVGIMSFGVIVAEMLTGKRLFEGETVTDVIAAVVTGPLTLENVPAAIRPALAPCLERDPRKRLRHIGDFRIVVEASTIAAPPHPALAAVALVAAAAAGAVFIALSGSSVPSPPLFRLRTSKSCR
jgi:serine/threonine protein kinase